MNSLPEEQKAAIAKASIPMPEDIESIHAEDLLEATKDIGSWHSMGIPEIVRGMFQIIERMNCCFMVSANPKAQFITADNPCTLVNPKLEEHYGLGTLYSSPALGQSDVELTLPLSSKTTVLWGWKMKSDGQFAVVNEK